MNFHVIFWINSVSKGRLQILERKDLSGDCASHCDTAPTYLKKNSYSQCFFLNERPEKYLIYALIHKYFFLIYLFNIDDNIYQLYKYIPFQKYSYVGT